jgi:CRISPR-associated protein Csd2
MSNTQPTHCNPALRHDFVFLFDVKDGNPNGDPDAGNMPRIDIETSEGLVTDVCIKRKIRNYIATYGEYEIDDKAVRERLKIFVEHRGILNAKIRNAYDGLGIKTIKPAEKPLTADLLLGVREIDPILPNGFIFSDNDEDSDQVSPTLKYTGEAEEDELKEFYENEEAKTIFNQYKGLRKFIQDLVKEAGKPDKNRENTEKARRWMCENFFDVRMFGAVMSTGLNAGQVRGAMQLTFSRSLHPVTPSDLTVTRVAVTKEEDADKKETEMGKKTLIPYGLFRGYGFYSAYLGEQVKVSATDLELFWQALINMCESDRSASRGMMAVRGIYVFSHSNRLGNAPAHKLFDRIQINLKKGVTIPRQFSDYEISIDESDLAPVILTKLI